MFLKLALNTAFRGNVTNMKKVPSFFDEIDPNKRLWKNEAASIQHLDTSGLHTLLWDLNTDDKIPKLTWWWWWWLFFIKNEKEPEKTKQLMILWSTKECDEIFVNDHLWKKKEEIRRKSKGKDGQVLTFGGMVAVWYYDGEKMLDPFFLKECDFELVQEQGRGYLLPKLEKDYSFRGENDKFVVNIKGGEIDFSFELTPWNRFLSTPRYSKRNYFGSYGYEILKLYGMKMRGNLDLRWKKEKISGSAYFQKVTVNAPTVPWYWGVLHTERGDYLDYFMPHLGLGMFRRSEKPRSYLDRCEIPLSKNLQFYDAERDELFRFHKLRIKKEFDRQNLPIFHIKAKSRSGQRGEGEISLSLRSYSRAYWRFEQKYLKLFRAILYYNEYPVVLEDFEFRWKFEDGSSHRLRREDLGYVTGNSEHAWGKLL